MAEAQQKIELELDAKPAILVKDLLQLALVI